MAKVFPGRHTARIDGPFVVFLVGMRVNRLWQVHKWMPVARAMGPMIRELMANKDSGLLHLETMLTWRGVATLQYWRSFEQLHAYAHARDLHHRPAWAAYNRAVGGNGSVGVWHETYQVAEGRYECIYANMPLWGMAGAGEHLTVVQQLNDAKSGMGGESQG